MMLASKSCIAFIKAFESCRLDKHWDAVGQVWDCGWGHVLQPTDPEPPWTQAQADAIFENDLERFENAVRNTIKVELRQHEFDALVSLAYNIGSEAFAKSSMPSLINDEKFTEAACHFMRFGLAKGKWVAGLLRRRAGEQAIFLLADYSRVP
jgi:lysozyme